MMKWIVRFHDEFEKEFMAMAVEVQDELLARARLIATVGPTLGRPQVDTLAGSKHANMKEMRFDAGNGVWRVAFAFDPERSAILLVAGDKSGVSQKRFYRSLIDRADCRFNDHLKTLPSKRREPSYGTDA
jgi:hypothetical protein